MKLEVKWRKAVAHYVKLLRLGEWDVETRVGKLKEGRGAEVTFAEGEKRACITLAEDALLNGGQYEAEVRSTEVYQAFGTVLDFLAAHEVVHLLEQPFVRLVFVAVENMGPFVHGVLDHEEERLTSSIARILAKLSPSGVR